MTAMTPWFHFDGICSYQGVLERYGVYQDEASCLRNEVICRIFALVQAVLTVAFSTVRQLVRGTTFLLGGIFTFDFGRIKFAFKDFISVVIQAVIMPILGVISTLRPKTGYDLAHWINTSSYCYGEGNAHTQLNRENGEHVIETHRFIDQPIVGNAGFVAKLLLHMTAPIQLIARLVHAHLQAIFIGDFHSHMLWLPLSLIIGICIVPCEYKNVRNYHNIVEITKTQREIL